MLKPATDGSNLLNRLRNGTMYGQAEWSQVDQINHLAYNQPVGFYMRLLLAAVIAASNNYCLLLAGIPPLGGHTSSLGGIPPINNDCVDGGNKQCSFLKPMVAGKKISLFLAVLIAQCELSHPAQTCCMLMGFN